MGKAGVMNRAAFLVPLAALSEIAAAPPSPPVPQVSQSPMRIASFQAGAVRCGALEKIPIRAVAPLPVAAAIAEPGEPVRLAFRIDQEGRPLSIRQIGPAYPALDLRDLAPALAAWRFEPGAGQSDCEIAFTVRLNSVESAEDALLYRYAALGRMQFPDSSGGALVGQAFVRLRPQGSNCVPDPAPREPISLPFQSIPELPGGMSYSFFSYDVDAQGTPVHIRLLNSSGNGMLDMSGDIAVGRARFPPRPRTGCLYYFYRHSTEAASAPAQPPVDFHPAGSACADDISREVATRFRMRYPVEFMRRPAEGWVVFTHDVERSGALANIRILASEPAARFGEEVLRAAAEVRVDASPNAQRGCVQRVRFVLPRR
jgi:TonB family protein